MNKSETREVAKLAQAHKLGMSDYVARGLSALIRSSMSGRTAAQMHQLAREWRVADHPEFIV